MHTHIICVCSGAESGFMKRKIWHFSRRYCWPWTPAFLHLIKVNYSWTYRLGRSCKFCTSFKSSLFSFFFSAAFINDFDKDGYVLF